MTFPEAFLFSLKLVTAVFCYMLFLVGIYYTLRDSKLEKTRPTIYVLICFIAIVIAIAIPVSIALWYFQPEIVFSGILLEA
ncbi:MAG: hypothetical protein CVU46_09565 [Chloroflexi bacterium HGW-Chloroflexi-8]|nr:MAG: hypothetical protein CVU46_09565 [Chloroflexi bacterium HGW-Chloroflexi-8]